MKEKLLKLFNFGEKHWQDEYYYYTYQIKYFNTLELSLLYSPLEDSAVVLLKNFEKEYDICSLDIKFSTMECTDTDILFYTKNHVLIKIKVQPQPSIQVFLDNECTR